MDIICSLPGFSVSKYNQTCSYTSTALQLRFALETERKVIFPVGNSTKLNFGKVQSLF